MVVGNETGDTMSGKSLMIKFVIPSKENDEQLKSNVKNFYLL